MAFDQETIEQMGAWCFNTPELAAERKRAWRQFFGEDDPRPVKYWTNADEQISRERRLLGWFMFDYVLPSDDLAHPEVNDVLDDLGALALKMGGEVVIVPTERMPTETGIAAIYRY